ncbi:hypothetical protein CO112_00890 [Candidatus Dojkabacteria bacterium CG_4_9_14_3_um_filter_150_Dojkabacteria_WS6_41_13]|uniref:Uncharacterized protein n=1 Tax=Candidatus Dojkabacteria bacterium CG_4_10_14_0_2_um_filter_Dojkabacteria_WS6_41_15 TaxID=2014249 RepID=A0A2M7W2P2_9BACT|nr:MAG: hypothetical protein COX64_01335 [Candidatus Dojkabacteria bacterium CG_4_10_14_0_2_um_filter_Dojkabacteria_WS6_41_15]PJB23449.1 MAG: hypothetical protein CO112_00890 [Candidatus Dojkabacteria bacterium CG_4_9_14_3_um_filter_150_Dojkabacteria_WS6_41_13]
MFSASLRSGTKKNIIQNLNQGICQPAVVRTKMFVLIQPFRFSDIASIVNFFPSWSPRLVNFGDRAWLYKTNVFTAARGRN